MFAKSYVPSMIPEIMKDWGDILKSNNLLFIPENISESPEYKEQMQQAQSIYETKISP